MRHTPSLSFSFSFFKLFGAFALAALMASPPIARAQSPSGFPGASEVRGSISGESGWTYFPGTVGQSVAGFLASLDPSTAPRGSFTVVWFELVAPGQFTMEGWTETSLEDAAAIIATRFSEQEMFQFADLASSPMSQAALGAGLMILPPVETNNGIAVDDPWQPVSDQLSAADIGFLVDNGYAVGAASLSEGGETTAPCPDDFDANSMALSELAVKVETDLFGSASTPSAVPAGAPRCCAVPQAQAAAVWCVTWTAWNPWGPGFPLAVVPPACRWTRTGTQTTTCGFCWWSTSWTTPVTQPRQCPVALPGACPATPPC